MRLRLKRAAFAGAIAFSPSASAPVTNDDVKRVAARYFAKTNRTVLDVVASPAEKSAEGAAK